MRAYVYLTGTGSFVFKKDLVPNDPGRQLVGMMEFPLLNYMGYEMPEWEENQAISVAASLLTPGVQT